MLIFIISFHFQISFLCYFSSQSKSNGVDLKGLIMAPIQSIVRYLMLLKELLTVTPVTHVDHPQLKLARENF